MWNLSDCHLLNKLQCSQTPPTLNSYWTDLIWKKNCTWFKFINKWKVQKKRQYQKLLTYWDTAQNRHQGSIIMEPLRWLGAFICQCCQIIIYAEIVWGSRRGQLPAELLTQIFNTGHTPSQCSPRPLKRDARNKSEGKPLYKTKRSTRSDITLLNWQGYFWDLISVSKELIYHSSYILQ